MFEQQIERTKALVVEQTIRADDSIKLQQILDSNIIQPLKTFFISDVDERVEEELHRLMDSPHFDYTEDSLHSIILNLNQKSKMHTIYKRDEYIQALDRAIKLLFNYTCRPQWTQVKFIYDEIFNKSAAEIMKGLDFFYDYSYYKVILEKYFSKRNIFEFPVAKFEELIHLIDEEIVKNFNSKQMAELSLPIFKLCNIGADEMNATVPIEALSVFYDDKGNSAIVERLTKERETKGNISLTMFELEQLISEVDFAVSVEISELVNLHVSGGSKEKHEITGSEYDELQFSSDQKLFEEELPQEYVPEKFESIAEIEPFELPEEVKGDTMFSVPEFTDLEFEELELNKIKETEFKSPVTVDENEKGILAQPEHLQTEINKFVDHSSKQKIQEPEKVDEEFAPFKTDDSIPDLSMEFERAFEDENKDNAQIRELDAEFGKGEAKKEDKLPEFSFDNMRSEKKEPEPIEESEERAFEKLPSKQQEAISDGEAIKRFGDLRTLISSPDKKKYIKKIFSRNEEKYATAIDVLNKKGTWKEASEYIDEIFLNNDVDMYSRVAVHFTDEIYKRYLQKK